MRKFVKDILNTLPFAIVLFLVIAVCFNIGPSNAASDVVATLTEVPVVEAAAPTETAKEVVEAKPAVDESTSVEPVQSDIVFYRPAKTESEETTEADSSTATSPYAELVNQLTDEDLDVLTRLVYHESRGNGGKAVIEVVFNRMLDKRFPNTLQGVVYQKNQFEPAPNLYNWPIKEPDAYALCEQEVQELLSPDYTPILPSYYVFFNNFGAGETEDYCWLGGNVFFGEYTLGF